MEFERKDYWVREDDPNENTGKEKPVFEAEVYDVDVVVKLYSFSDDGKANIEFEISAEIDIEDLKKLKPIFDYTKRIQPEKFAVWKMRLEHLRDEKY